MTNQTTQLKAFEQARTQAYTHRGTHKESISGVTFTSLREYTLSDHVSELFQGNIGILSSIFTVMDVYTILWLGALKVQGRGNKVRPQNSTFDRY